MCILVPLIVISTCCFKYLLSYAKYPAEQRKRRRRQKYHKSPKKWKLPRSDNIKVDMLKVDTDLMAEAMK